MGSKVGKKAAMALKPRGAAASAGTRAQRRGGGRGGRGGRGGAKAEGVPGPRETDRLNSMVVIAGLDVLRDPVDGPAFEAALIETVDPADRAHGVKVGGPGGTFLAPAAVHGKPNRTLHARPRRYPASHINNAGLAIDSQFDDLHERQVRLGGIAGVGRTDVAERAWMRDETQAVEQRYAGTGGYAVRVRATFQETTDPEAERAGTALLVRAKVAIDGTDFGGSATELQALKRTMARQGW